MAKDDKPNNAASIGETGDKDAQEAIAPAIRSENITHLPHLHLLKAALDANKMDSGEFYYLKDLLIDIATYSTFSLQDAAAWLATELESASEYERPAWFELANDHASEVGSFRQREAPASHKDGMSYLRELATRGPARPRDTQAIGFHHTAICPFVMRRLANLADRNPWTGPTQNAEDERDAKIHRLEGENDRLQREIVNKLLDANSEHRYFLISNICAAILKTDDMACELFGREINSNDERIFGDMARMALHKIGGKTACDPGAEYWRLTDWAMDHAPSPPHLYFERFNVRSSRDLIHIVLRKLEGEQFFGTTIWYVMEHVHHGVPVYRARSDGTYEEVERGSPDVQAMRYLGRSGICSNAGLSMFPDIMRPEYYFKVSDLEAYRLFFRGDTPDDEGSLSVIRDAYRRHVGASDCAAPRPTAGSEQDEVIQLKAELDAVKRELAEARQAAEAKASGKGAATGSDVPLTGRGKATLTMLWAFIGHQFGFKREAAKNDATGKIQLAMRTHSIEMNETTIRERIKEAMAEYPGRSANGK